MNMAFLSIKCRAFVGKSLRGLISILFLCLPFQASAFSAAVMDVHDGDTLRIAPSGDTASPLGIRLYGIDAPELNQPGGKESAAYLARLLPQGVRVEIVPLGNDRYGRVTGLVMYQGKAVNRAMLEAGQAWYYPKYCRAAICKGWQGIQRDAAKARRGLWRSGEAVAPWKWRDGINEHGDNSRQ